MSEQNRMIGSGATAPVVCAGLWLCFRVIPAATVALLVLLFLCASPARARVDSSVGAGHMRWFDAGAGSYQSAVTQRSRLQVSVAGLVALVELEQRFHNATDDWQEGIYSYPLPPDAAVRHLEMVVGERRVVGRIRERQSAQTLYRQARAAGKKAALVEQQRPNLFSSRIANIAPGESVLVRLEYVQQVSYRDGGFSLRIPTTLTPRYIPGVSQRDSPAREAPGFGALDYPGFADATDLVADAAAVTPWQYPQPGSEALPLNPLRIEVELDAGVPLAAVETPYHTMTTEREGGRYRLELARGVTEMDRDFLLRWRPVAGAEPQAAVFTEQVAGEYYGLLLVMPPESAAEGQVSPRELVFVIDTSGSMAGTPIEHARASLTAALQRLRASDTFNIIAFDSQTRALFSAAVPATRHHLGQASEFVRQLRAGGGTEMRPALERALQARAQAPQARRLRQVIFITDGAVGNEQALFDVIAQHLGESRLFTLGIGAAPNRWFMERAAALGRGFSVQVGAAAEVSTAMDQLLARIEAPLALDLVVEWPQTVAARPQRVPDLYRGEPLVQAVHFGASLPVGEVRVTGHFGGQPWSRRVPLLPQPGSASHSGVASLWARREIAGLLAQRSTGKPEAAIRPAVLAVALTHQLLSPYTSFVAIEEQASRDPLVPLRASAVPNTRPRGQAAQPYAYPATATTGRARLFLGCFSLFIALLVYVMRRPEEDRVRAS